ncbi:ATP synthase subunit c [Planctomycetes bacterium Pan216]|uniref:ATP synthase subunit c n=1 Tax=Kolteria novifilia TaxID=2527975 RepID=A0A518B8D4_9BACT|nr:ATP synthase subunit c [Planctomycetes bacterium Pan216]
MSRAWGIFLVVAVVVLAMATPAMAQESVEEGGFAGLVKSTAFGAGIGAALTIVGAAYGISTIGARAVESMARQPEVAAQISTAMIIAAALIEGVTFFALIVCILIALS